MEKQQIQWMGTDAVRPYENNPRVNDDAVDAVANSIREFGFQSPIIVDRDMVIIAGHTRIKAARKLGMDTVPVIVAKAVLNSSNKGDTVLDLFGGSGTTMMACEQTGRKCRMMELDPGYCDVIVQRWEAMTGRKAELVEA